jgi:hypothetical protein
MNLKSLTYRIHKELKNSIANSQIIQIKMGYRSEQTFLQKRYTNGLQITGKKCSTLLTTGEMEIKTAMKCHPIPVRMAISKKDKSRKFW